MRYQLILIFLLLASKAQATIKVDLEAKPNPPEAGENIIRLHLKDDSGKGLEKANVSLNLYMPAMGTMPRMDEKSIISEKGQGLYEAKFDLSMAGTWEMDLLVEKGSEKLKSHFSLTTGVPGIAGKGSSEQEVNTAPTLDLGPRRLQTIGVRFSTAENREMKSHIEAVGTVEQDQTHREELTLRYSGYLVKQFRGRIGDTVKKGDPLFSVYSPELVTAQSEFLLASKLSDDQKSLHDAASERLKNLGLSPSDIASIKKSGQTQRDIIVRSPITGNILDISLREGAAINPGQVLYIIGDLSKSYIVARIFQEDLQNIRLGQLAALSVPGISTKAMEGKVDLIYPQIEQGGGTANIRIEFKEALPGLKPGVFVDVFLPVEHGKMLVIPREAILYSGRHRYVFVDKGKGKLEPREVATGQSIDGNVQVIDGLSEGERVASSGTFLLGSEAQLRSALPKWSDSTEKKSPEGPHNHHGAHP